MSSVAPPAYDGFAWVYNRHWGPYAGQALSIIHELLPNGPTPGSHILDLCCGTGQLAALLTSQDHCVTGIDASAQMLRFARENAPDVQFAQADARAFSLAHPCDGAVSTFDSLNCILTIEDLTRVFANVHAALKPGGWFLFDMNTEAGYLYHWEDGTFSIVEDDHACIIRSDYDADEHLAQFDVTIFSLAEGWQRHDFTLTQRCHAEEAVRSALAAVGFVDIAVHGYDDERGLTELHSESERMYFTCTRP